MKKFMLALMLMISVPAMAQHHGHGLRHHHWHGGANNWMAPAIIGGVVTYVLTRPTPQPVVIEQPIILQQQTVCSSWREVQQQDGTILRERTCYQR